jgi:hypothetical protein
MKFKNSPRLGRTLSSLAHRHKRATMDDNGEGGVENKVRSNDNSWFDRFHGRVKVLLLLRNHRINHLIANFRMQSHVRNLNRIQDFGYFPEGMKS